MRWLILKLKLTKKFILTIIVILMPAVAIYAQLDLQDGLIAHYPFNGNANDDSGNGHNGTVQGATLTTDRSGNANSAYEFDGNEDYILVQGDPVFNVNKSGYSILLWLYIDDNQFFSYPRIMGYGGNNSNGWDIELMSSHLAFNFNNNLSQEGCHISANTSLNKWFQYVMVYSNDTMKLFIDGEFVNYKYCPEYHAISGFDLVIGASSTGLNNEFVGKIDEIRIYNRALSNVEVALLSGNNSVINFAQKGTDFYADFEDGTFKSYGEEYDLALEYGGELHVVQNPQKDNTNSSDYVLISVIRDSEDVPFSRAEYFTDWSAPFETRNRKHIFQWMVYFPDDYLDGVDIKADWSLLTQFVTHPCANGEEDFDDAICGDGGIFNELSINSTNYDEYLFRYRAAPSCNSIRYRYPKGKWIKFTYEIFWTTEFNGYYKVWANEELLGEAENVRTLPEGFIDGDCDMRWKVGLYSSWTSDVVDSVYYYIDNLEVFVNNEIEDIDLNPSDRIKLVPNPARDEVQIVGMSGLIEVSIFNIKGKLIKTFVTQNEFSVSGLKQGIYFVKLKKENFNVTKKIIKL